jgi:hypothetical protein
MLINKTLKDLIISHYGFKTFCSISDNDKRKVYGYKGTLEMKNINKKNIYIQTYYHVATDLNKSLCATLLCDNVFYSLHFFSFFDICDLPIYLDLTNTELKEDFDEKKCINAILFNLGLDTYMILDKYNNKEEFMSQILEELMKKTWHPDRVFNWCLDIDEQKEF